MTQDTTELIHYPETLIAIWNRLHARPSKLSEAEISAAWQMLANKLSSSVISDRPDIGFDQAQDAVDDFLPYFFRKPLGEIEAKTQFQHLFRDLKQKMARDANPAGYEFSGILREAIRTLEKNQQVIRDDASRGKNISQRTSFKLSTSPQREATFIDYQKNAARVSTYTTKMRNGSFEHAKIITPKDAQQLILELLSAFDGWTNWKMLLKAAFKHIPEECRFHLVKLRRKDGDDNHDADELDRLQAKNTQNDTAETLDDESVAVEFYGEQRAQIIIDTSERIWTAICAMNGSKLFCLYHIPRHYGTEKDHKPTLQDFGSPSTMGDQDKKISLLLKNEMEVIPGITGNSRIAGAQRQAVLTILSGILQKLCRRCTEIGYNPRLSDYER